MGSGEDIHIEQDGTKVIKFGFTHDNGASGWVIRSFHPEKKHLEFRDSYFDDKLPRLMRHDGEMIEGKGTPAIAYMDMLAMRRLGVGYGELRTATICSVHDLDSALQLEWLQRHLEQKPLSEFSWHCHSDPP